MALTESRFTRFLFKYRSYTPIPLIVVALLFARPGGWSLWVGLPMIFAGEAIRVWALGYIGPSSRTDKPLGECLVTCGPYAFTRNPLYIGNFFLVLGIAFYSGALIPWLPIATVILFITQYAIIIPLEEKQLTESNNRVYRRYAAAVPSIIPRITPYKERSAHTFELKVSLNGEIPTLHTVFLLLWLLPLAWWLRSCIPG